MDLDLNLHRRENLRSNIQEIPVSILREFTFRFSRHMQTLNNIHMITRTMRDRERNQTDWWDLK
jgi:hypothetical protein